jgi:hypothetical protein
MWYYFFLKFKIRSLLLIVRTLSVGDKVKPLCPQESCTTVPPLRIHIHACPVQISSTRRLLSIQIKEQQHIEAVLSAVFPVRDAAFYYTITMLCCKHLFQRSITTITIPVMIVKNLYALNNTPPGMTADKLLRSAIGSS